MLIEMARAVTSLWRVSRSAVHADEWDTGDKAASEVSRLSEPRNLKIKRGAVPLEQTRLLALWVAVPTRAQQRRRALMQLNIPISATK
jgi:hypothetical protein